MNCFNYARTPFIVQFYSTDLLRWLRFVYYFSKKQNLCLFKKFAGFRTNCMSRYWEANQKTYIV